MLNTINLWIKQIVMVVVFAAFIDFLIPENKFLKYIKVFLGLLVMIAIVNPLVPLLQKGVSIDIEIPQGYKNFVNKSGIKHDSEVLNKPNNKLTIEEYKLQVEKYIAQKLADMTLYNVKSVTAQIHEDYTCDNFGKITQLLIILSNIQTKDEKSEAGKILIETIKIGNSGKKLNFNNQNQNDEFKSIIKYLHTTFDIPKENIFIGLED